MLFFKKAVGTFQVTIGPLFKYKQLPGPYPKQRRWTGPSCTPGACLSPSSARSSGAGPEPGRNAEPRPPTRAQALPGAAEDPRRVSQGLGCPGEHTLLPKCLGERRRLPSSSPVTSRCCSALRFKSISGRKQQQLQGNSDCATEVTSQVPRLEKHCSTWVPCKHSFLLTHRKRMRFNSHQLVTSLTAGVFFERQSL